MELIAHNIRSLFNVGAFFRNADAFGVSKLYLSGYTATPPRDEISKVALGAENCVIWEKENDVLRLMERLKKEHKRVIAFEAKPSLPSVSSFTFYENDVLMFGNEPDGIPDDVLKYADDVLYIPMFGKKSSLNVAVASGVALYAARLSCEYE